MNIIGQEKLLNKLNTYSVLTMPRTIMFIGPHGCGKHLVSKYLADKVGFDLLEPEVDVLTPEFLIELSQKTVPTFCIIDLTKFTEKQQNQFLKFIEEPTESIYIILLAESEANVLPTILGRSIKFIFEDYAKEQLKEFSFLTSVTDDRFFEICKTPGQLANINDAIFKELCSLCEAILQKVHDKRYAEVLTIMARLNTKGVYDKIDFQLFLAALQYFAFQDFVDNKTKQSFDIYLLTKDYQKKTVKNIENLILGFLTELWKITR